MFCINYCRGKREKCEHTFSFPQRCFILVVLSKTHSFSFTCFTDKVKLEMLNYVKLCQGTIKFCNRYYLRTAKVSGLLKNFVIVILRLLEIVQRLHSDCLNILLYFVDYLHYLICPYVDCCTLADQNMYWNFVALYANIKIFKSIRVDTLIFSFLFPVLWRNQVCLIGVFMNPNKIPRIDVTHLRKYNKWNDKLYKLFLVFPRCLFLLYRHSSKLFFFFLFLPIFLGLRLHQYLN